MDIPLRRLRTDDRAPLARVLVSTGAFTEEEVAVALERVDAGLTSDDRDYQFIVADEGDGAMGYVCFRRTRMTEGTWEIYWIAVARDRQGTGVGKALLQAAEAEVRDAGARMLLLETASKQSYATTRAFYLGNGYAEMARVPDFYAAGDDKVIYGKRF